MLRARAAAASPALLLLVVVAVAGCGSGKADAKRSQATTGAAVASTSAGGSPVAQANAICAERNRQLESSTRPGATLREIVGGAPRRVAIQRTALTALEKLVPPASVERYWRTILADDKAALQGTEKLAKLADSSSGASVAREKALMDRPELGLLAAATRVGAKQCAVIAGPSVRGL